VTQVRTNGIWVEAEFLQPPTATPSAPPEPSAPFAPSEPSEPSAPSSDRPKTPVLLIMGLGMQLTAWPDAFVDGLLATGHPVIRFDNRDIGLSSKLGTWGRPNLLATAIKTSIGLPIRSAYTLHDMAADTAGMLDALGVARAHVVGVSMGGMIGQILAARHRDRVASFTCIMSSSGARHLPGPTPAARSVLLARPRTTDPEAIVEHFIRVVRVIGSPGYPTPEDQARERVLRGVRRSVHPLGFVRQLVAISATPDRSPLLREITAPTTIVHGHHDPLVPVAAAHDLAAKIPGAELVVIDGMGHDLPPGLTPTLLGAIGRTIARAEAKAAPAPGTS
jgi:pimeloyl-ACP methyl ester carboxylesterase